MSPILIEIVLSIFLFCVRNEIKCVFLIFQDNLFALNQSPSNSQFTRLTRRSISFPLKTRLVSSVNIIKPRRCRSAAAYSRQTFPWTICPSIRKYVRAYVRASIGLSSAIVEKRRIRSGCHLAS